MLSRPFFLQLFPKTSSPPKPEIKLTEELTSSLRRLVPEGNVLDDRVANLHKRNMLEYRAKKK